jgi:hypothetical protein
MKLNMRCDEGNPVHQRITIFINGKNTGTLTVDPADVFHLQMIFSKGMTLDTDDFIASGKCYTPEDEENE